MLKKMLKSAVAALIASSAASAMAANLSGVYTAQSAQGQEITLELQSQGSDIRGVVRVNGQQLPLVAREDNGNLQGVFRAANGQPIQIAGMQTDNGLSIVANGVTYQFGRADAAQNNVAAQPQNQLPAQPNTPVAAPQNAQIVQGEIFSIPVPQGWQTSQSTNEVAAVAPDSSMMFGFVGLERVQAMDAPGFLKFMINMYGNKNLQILEMHQVSYPGASQAIEAKVSVTGSNGVNYQSWARVAVFISGGQMNAYAVYASATPDRFERVAGQLQAMAEKIQVTNAQLAFDRARALNNIKMVKNNPMDNTVVDGYWDRSKRMDAVMARGSDVRRDSYTSTDPSTGQQYNHTQAAWDPTRGGVVNPNRPTELLDPAAHWQNR